MDNLESKNVQRNSGSRKESVDEEVQKLLKKSSNKVTENDFNKLREKYGNEELVEKIQNAYLEKFSEITKRAKKFAQLIREKYSNSQYPFHILLEKAIKYKEKHNLSDEEFAEFQRIYENELVGLRSNEIMQPSTNIGKMLGNISINNGANMGRRSDSDYKFEQEIYKLHAATKQLHAQVVLQSMMYEDCKIEAITGKFNKDINNSANHVHPVLAALFFPKIDTLDSHFLRSNIANIVHARLNNTPFTTTDDYKLFDALVKDPNDIVCNSKSTMEDLYTRALLQQSIWSAVLNLRNGQYYKDTFKDFIPTIDVCRLNKHDTPDLVYGRYDGTVIKRLLSAFSFRPTVVATVPAYQIFNRNPYQQNVSPVVAYVPMINLKLPPSNNNDPIDLEESLEQQQYFLENGVIVPKQTSLIFSNDVLFFFVDRRANVIKTVNTLQPFGFTNNLSTALGFERLNNREVIYKPIFNIRNDEYRLRSVVLSEVNQQSDAKNLIVGSSAVIMIHSDHTKGIYSNEFLLYNPMMVSEAAVVNGTVQRNAPCVQIPETSSNVDDEFAFDTMARRRGIIFMYQLTKNNSKGEVNF
jgi:hypothetical protein